MNWWQPVRIDDLVPDIGLPDYPAMPSADEALPLAGDVEDIA